MTDLASLVISVDSTSVPKGVAALNDLTKSGKAAETQSTALVVAQRRTATAHDDATNAVRRNQYAMRSLGQQFGDFGQQALSGAGVMRAFAQQIGQVAFAMSEFESGPLKRVGTFLGGPWGVALTLATQAVAAFAIGLEAAGDAAEESKKKLADWSNWATLAAKNAEVIEKLTRRSQLQFQLDAGGGPTPQGKAFFQGTEAARRLRAEIDSLSFDIESNSNLIKLWQGRLQEAADREDAATAAVRAAAEAKREHNKVLRDEAKAMREAAKAAEDYYNSAFGGGALRTLNNMRNPVSASELNRNVSESARLLQEELDRRRALIDHESAERSKADQHARDMFIKTAYDFADIVGGSFGDSIKDLADVLEREFPAFVDDLGRALSKLGVSDASGALSALGVGAQIGSATDGIMKGLGIRSSNTGAQIGGAIGSAVGGPIGALAGSILGGVVGGMLKGVKKASATIEITAGEAVQSSLTGNSSKLKAAASAMADSLIGGLTKIADQLGGMLGDGIRVSIGQRKDTYRVDLQGLGRTKNMPSFKTQEEAVAYAIQQVIQQGAITGLRAGTDALLKGQGDLEAQLSKALTFEGVFQELEQRTDPVGFALKQIAKQFEELTDIFEEAGASEADYAKLAELRALKEAEASKQAEKVIEDNSERLGLERRILELQGDTAALRALELDALLPANRALQERIYALEDAAAAELTAAQAAREAADAAEAAARQAADAAKEAADAAADEAKRLADIARQRGGLQAQILELMGDKAGALAIIRQQELETMDASLRPLQETVYALQDMATAADAAAEAQRAAAEASQEAARAAEKFAGYRDNLRELRDSLSTSGITRNSYQAAQARFIQMSARANMGDEGGLTGLPDAINAFIAQSRGRSTASQFQRDVAAAIAAADKAAQAADGRATVAEGVETLNAHTVELNDNVEGMRDVLRTISNRQTDFTNELAGLRADIRANLEPIVFNTARLDKNINGSMVGGILTVRANADEPLPVDQV